MKRLLALLLALLLPGCAAAQTYGFTVSVDLDETAFAAYAKQAMQLVPQLAEYDADALANAVAKSLNGLSVDASVQEDAAALNIRLAKGNLVELALHTTEDAVYYTSPMLSGYALWAEMEPQTAIGAEKAKTDLSSVVSSWEEAVERWLSDIEPTTTSGIFDGDAYSGGTRCITYSLTDQDIAALFNGLLTDELAAYIQEQLESMELDITETLDELHALNARVADEDVHLYILRIVSNDAGEFVGASLTVIKENAQVATVSVGMTDQTLRLVIGLGLSEQNYWWELQLKEKQQDSISYFSGTSREWLTNKEASYSYISSTNAPLATYQLRGTLTRAAGRLLWDGGISKGSEAANVPLCAFNGSYVQATGNLDCSVSLGRDKVLRLTFSAGQMDEIAPMDASLKLCSMTSSDDAPLYEELTKKFAASLMTRMIKLLPMDLIMTINEFKMPK